MYGAESHLGSYEHDHRKVIDMISDDTKRALSAHDGGILLETIEQGIQNETLQTLGLRLQLRDFWRTRKGDLAKVSGGNIVDIENDLRQMFTLMDDDFAAIVKNQDYEEVNSWGTTLISELRRLSPEDRIAFINQFAELDLDDIGTSDTLLPWVHEWRNQLVEDLWIVAQDLREQGPTAELSVESSEVFGVANSHIDNLINGALHPEDV